MANPSFYLRDRGEIAQVKTKLEALERDLGTTYERWETLEDLA
jgi:hypothetical protein